jgi:hypothetical protein
MSEHKMMVMVLKGVVSELPEAQRNQVNATVEKLRAVVQGAGDVGGIALALVGSEAAAASEGA